MTHNRRSGHRSLFPQHHFLQTVHGHWVGWDPTNVYTLYSQCPRHDKERLSTPRRSSASCHIKIQIHGRATVNLFKDRCWLQTSKAHCYRDLWLHICHLRMTPLHRDIYAHHIDSWRTAFVGLCESLPGLRVSKYYKRYASLSKCTRYHSVSLDHVSFRFCHGPLAFVTSQAYTPLFDGRQRLQRCSPDATINTYTCKTILNSKLPSGPVVFFVLSRSLRALLKWKCITLLLHRRILPFGIGSIRPLVLSSRITPHHKDGGTVSKAPVCYLWRRQAWTASTSKS
jgi:hypothetical protein